MKIGALVVVAILAMGLAHEARACSFPADFDHAIDPNEVGVDITAPSQPVVLENRVNRGVGASGCSRSSCDDLGSVYLLFESTDDRTPSNEIGLVLELVAGQLPQGLELPAGPIVGPSPTLVWIDGASDSQEAVEFTLRVSAIDLAGNIGPPIDVVVTDLGSGGCTIGVRGAQTGPLAILVIGLLLLRRFK